MNEQDKRIINGINYFRRELHGEFNGKMKVHLCTLFNLIEERIKGVSVHAVELSNEPRGFSSIEEVFPKSEGFTYSEEGVNAAGLNNAKSVSPDETASQQTKDDRGLNN